MAKLRMSQYVIEALVPTDAFSPTSITGCGVSQVVVEVLGSFSGSARVTQVVVEVLFTGNDTQTAPGGGGTPSGATTHSFSYVI